jgi:glycerophosphoryl diester phosphodiesterase
MPPPDSLDDEGSWETESQGIMTGTEGWATYGIGGSGTVTFRWNNPYVGSNRYGLQCTRGFRGYNAGGSGDNAIVDFHVERDGGLALPPRPFYAVAHRTNSAAAIASALTAGANALECDLRRDVVDHDGVFRWSTPLDEWLEAARLALIDHPQLALIYCDIKEPTAMGEIIVKVRARLPLSINVVFSCAAYADRVHFVPLVSSLRAREGFAIDEHEDPVEVGAFFSQNGVERCWYGNGIFVAGPPWTLPRIEASVRDAIRLRDTQGTVKRVAVWTLADRVAMESYIRLGVDAILVNTSDLSKLTNLVGASTQVRMATRSEDAF